MRLKRKTIDVNEAEIPLTPLIDVVLLLLVFFMLTSTFVIQAGIKIELPTADSSKELKDKPIRVEITKNDKVFLDGDEIVLSNLQILLQTKIKSKAKLPSLNLLADKLTYYDRVVKIMDISQKAGITHINLATVPLQESLNKGSSSSKHQ